MVRLPSTKAENLKYLLTIMPDYVWGKYLAQYLYVCACVCMPACLYMPHVCRWSRRLSDTLDIESVSC